MKILKKSYIFFLAVAISGCAFFAGVTPHENFKNHIYSEIGKSIDNAPSYSWRHEKDLLESKVLPNGNIENKYRYLRTCVYYFEIDPCRGPAIIPT